MSIFQTIGSLDDPLGLWTPMPQQEMVHFGLQQESSLPAVEAPLFRVNLPENLQAAQQAFERSEANLDQVHTVLQAIPNRLDDLLHQIQARQTTQSTVSFAANSLTVEPGPESALLELLEDISNSQPISFSRGDEPETIQEPLSQAWRKAKTDFESFLEQLEQTVLHFAWVETALAGQVIARSAVDWSGDTITAWAETASAEQKHLHQRALERATRTRHLNLRLFLTVSSGAAKIATLTATGTPILALPAAYQYVITLLKQAREIKNIP
ncbi:MAG: hypothetical protein DDG60_02395 [Anaerolineae bacterium]|nr:MAG: hypothetical protein DDG60_02395 [Anaerolineae bacterium]